MRIFRRLIALSLALLATFTLSSCNSNQIDKIYNSFHKNSFFGEYMYSSGALVDMKTNEQVKLTSDVFDTYRKDGQRILGYFVDGDYIYYSVSETVKEEYSVFGNRANVIVYKLNLKTFESEVVYYETNSSESKFLDLHQTSPQMSVDAITNFFVIGKELIFAHSKGISSIDLRTQKKTLLVEEMVDQTYFSYCQGKIYYINGKKELMSYALSTGDSHKMVDPRVANFLVTDNYIFFSSCSDSGRLYRSDLDGGNVIRITEKSAYSYVEQDGKIYAVLTDKEIKDIFTLTSGELVCMDYDGTHSGTLAQNILYVERGYAPKILVLQKIESGNTIYDMVTGRYVYDVDDGTVTPLE